MANENHMAQALELFRSFAGQERSENFAAAEAPVGGQGERTVTVPHPYYLVGGDSVLKGSLEGAERLAGYQSIIFQGDQPVEAPIAELAGEGISYLASWTPETALALNGALRVAEDQKRDTHDFAVVTVPEVGFTAVWLRQRHELVPMATNRNRGALDPSRIYSEAEVIEALRGPLEERLNIPRGGSAEEELTEPPTA